MDDHNGSFIAGTSDVTAPASKLDRLALWLAVQVETSEATVPRHTASKETQYPTN